MSYAEGLWICWPDRAKGNLYSSETENQEAKFLSMYSVGNGCVKHNIWMEGAGIFLCEVRTCLGC